MNGIVVEKVVRAYRPDASPRGFTHTFAPGSVTFLTGPSGCGKTTLLRLVAGLEIPDGGRITGVPGKIACVFQEDRLLEDFDAVENVRFVTGEARTRGEITALFDALGLGDAAERQKPVSELSGGMRRRVAIARALLYDADLCLLDEPFQGLDPALKETVIRTVRARLAGKTVIGVTHNPDEITAMGGVEAALCPGEVV